MPLIKRQFDVIGKRWWSFAFSLVLILVSVGSIAIHGFNYGIDFKGGIVIDAQFNDPVEVSSLRKSLEGLGLGEVVLQGFESKNEVMIRVQQHNNPEVVVGIIKRALKKHYPGGVTYRQIDVVGPQVGKELIMAGALSLAFALLGIMIYIWIRFEWQYGIGGIAALFHDTVVMIGFYSITGLEFNLTSIAAILTVIGYSINDSVVIYDRIRENMRKYKTMGLPELLNMSLNQTFTRTLLTGGTVLVAILALIIFGGPVIFGFSVAMFVGVIVGTYSSIVISAPILLYTKLRMMKEPQGEHQPA